MSTFLFSALLDRVAKPERLAFIERVFRESPASTRFVGFNLGNDADADFPVVNTRGFLKKAGGDVERRLHRVLQSAVPQQAEELLDQAVGEFSAMSDRTTHRLNKLMSNVEAFQGTLKKYRPDKVFLWNQFNSFHRIAAAICQAGGIPVAYFHDGVLPGSVSFDLDGEMGESWVTRFPDRLSNIAVSDAELKSADKFLQRLTNKSYKSRHAQRENILLDEALKVVGLQDRPLIFYAGQHDWHAGIKPRRPTSHLHSPVFSDTIDALHEIDRVAGEMRAAVVFKPHPLSRNRYEFLHAQDYPNTLILGHTDLNACVDRSSLIVTIASQVAYVGVMAQKPVVMLGRNQLTGKSLTYDVDSREGTRGVIETAMADPKRKTRREGFTRHMAQLQKAYLFDYGTLSDNFYTRGPKAVAHFIEQSLVMSPEALIDASLSSGIDDPEREKSGSNGMAAGRS